MKPTVVALVFALSLGRAWTQDTLPDTKPLAAHGDLSAEMVAGISRFLDGQTEQSLHDRQKHWHYDFTSVSKYARSVEENRKHLQTIIGAVDPRAPIHQLEFISGTQTPGLVAENETFTIYAVRWPVFENVFAEGLWLKPKHEIIAQVVAIPDADQTPEMLVGLAPGIAEASQFARRLAENGCEVLVPTLISREDTWSGNLKLNRFTNQPHREWIYRQSFEMGRHIIGYEVQKVLAAIEFFHSEPATTVNRIGVAGYGEGGLVAFYAAALDRRIDSALVSGYFDSRQRLWEEPIYRNLFGLLHEFGDAEIGSLVVPARLVVEYSPAPSVNGPPPPHDGRQGAAPGRISTPPFESVSNEFNRLTHLLHSEEPSIKNAAVLISDEGKPISPGSAPALLAFLQGLSKTQKLTALGGRLVDGRNNFSASERQRRQVAELVEHTQRIFRESERVRDELVSRRLKLESLPAYEASTKSLRDYFRDEVIGNFTNAFLSLNPRSRKISESEKFTEYEVVLDVYPDVFAWGYLLVPTDLKSGERRPVVVCQHGLEGVPQDVVTTDPNTEAFRYYQGFATRLAERGYVVFAPHNPYRGGDRFRVLQRKANPLQKTLFSVIAAEQEQILRWLGTLPFVDSSRIGFYGLSYGGKSAMRLPALLKGYSMSICSGDFNEWIQKNVSTDFPGSYMFTGEYEMPEFNLGNTFNYAEMAALIAPRPFMVERGHRDGVGVDSAVAGEYAKVRKLYDELGIGDRTKIEFFNGPHRINGVETYPFLDANLK